jgi:hypothetical protein
MGRGAIEASRKNLETVGNAAASLVVYEQLEWRSAAAGLR